MRKHILVLTNLLILEKLPNSHHGTAQETRRKLRLGTRGFHYGRREHTDFVIAS